MLEEWKEIPSFPGYYASSAGRIQSSRQVLKPYGKTYLKVEISGKTPAVHRLIAEAFLGSVHGLEVNHLDGNKKNNFLSNLELCDRRRNMKHSYEIGVRGNARGFKVLTQKERDEILELRKSGFTYAELARNYGKHPETIRKFCLGITWG